MNRVSCTGLERFRDGHALLCSARLAGSLVSAITENVSAAGVAPCNLTLSTSYMLNLAAKSPPTMFSGTATYSYSVASAVASNTDCTAQLRSNGGKYAALPCTVNYKLDATRQ